MFPDNMPGKQAVFAAALDRHARFVSVKHFDLLLFRLLTLPDYPTDAFVTL